MLRLKYRAFRIDPWCTFSYPASVVIDRKIYNKFKIWKNLYQLFHKTYICPNNMESNKKFGPDPCLKLTDQVRQVLRYYHCAYRTEQTYCDQIVHYITFHGSKKLPEDM